MTPPNRLRSGLIDRTQTLRFTFNGRTLTGHPGDTLASALLAHGLHRVARSFKYHRPRGIFSAGPEEPNALLTLGSGAHRQPNTRATTVELTDGLTAASQNHRGPLGFDVMAVNDWLSPFLGAGFYYKTFMWPGSFWERLYEPLIRRSAGLGALSGEPDPACYDTGYLHCDILVIGAGAAGLMAALAAGQGGARVILADEDTVLGGRLNAETATVDDRPGSAWAAAIAAQLQALPSVRVMPRTTVFGAYDHGIYGAVERRRDGPRKPAEILWRIYCRRAILCAGATERPIAFANNDRPGIMLAGAVRAYANRWAVACGRRVAVLTNNSDGYRTATDLHAQGVTVAGVIDTRPAPPPPTDDLNGVRVIPGACVINTAGRQRLKRITLSTGESLAVDCLAVSGGWNPNVQLTCHQGDRPAWRDATATFAPGQSLPPGMQVAGAAQGATTLHATLTQGLAAGNTAMTDLGFTPCMTATPTASDAPFTITPFWLAPTIKGRAWLDLQNDVTHKDIALAHAEGFRSVEHVKRYTTLGMGVDQGKTGNSLALALLAQHRGATIPAVGATAFRPPYTSVSIGVLGGRARGKQFKPVRLPPSHRWAEAQGAVFVEAGLWLRARWFPKPGETHWRQSVDREVTQTRNAVGVCDVSTLGKIDIQGRDTPAFVDFVYANRFANLPVGKVRYGLMLREDGAVMDDGATARLSDTQFIMTTTTAKAGAVFRHLEFVRQCLRPQWDVHLISITDAWAQYAVAGPQARRLLQQLTDPGFDLSNAAFPFMACAELSICGGTPARLFRVSFSGELAYELAVPARYGDSLMQTLMQAGEPLGVTPYGTEALNVMRLEKGHATGGELNGQTNARQLGMAAMLARKRTDFIGKVLSERQGLNRQDAPGLMGFFPVEAGAALTAGAHFIAEGDAATLDNDQGWMSSVAYSPTLGHDIGLGFIQRGAARLGDIVRAVDAVRAREVRVRVVSPTMFDPEGVRLRG